MPRPTSAEFNRDHPRWPEGAPLGLGGKFRPTGIHPSALRVFIGAAKIMERWARSQGRDTHLAMKRRFRAINANLNDETDWTNNLTDDTAHMRRVLTRDLRHSAAGTRIPATQRSAAADASARRGESREVDALVEDTPQPTGALGSAINTMQDAIDNPSGGEVFDGSQTLMPGDRLGNRPGETSEPMRYIGRSPSGRLRFASEGGRPTGSGQRRSAHSQAYVANSRVLQGRPIVRRSAPASTSPAPRSVGTSSRDVVDHDGYIIRPGTYVRAAGDRNNPIWRVSGVSTNEVDLERGEDSSSEAPGRLVVVPASDENIARYNRGASRVRNMPPPQSDGPSPARSPTRRLRNIRSMTRENLLQLATQMRTHLSDNEGVGRVNDTLRERRTVPFRDGTFLSPQDVETYTINTARQPDLEPIDMGPGLDEDDSEDVTPPGRHTFARNQRVWINPAGIPWPARVTGQPRLENGEWRVPIREVFTPANVGRDPTAIEGADRTIGIGSIAPRLHAFDSERQSVAHPDATASSDARGLAVRRGSGTEPTVNVDANFAPQPGQAPHLTPVNSQELAENIVAIFNSSPESALRPGETLEIRTPPSGRYSRIVRVRGGVDETFAHIRHRNTGGRYQSDHQISFVHGSDQILGSELRPGHFRNRPHGAAHRRLPNSNAGQMSASIVLNNALASATRRTRPSSSTSGGAPTGGFDSRRGQVPLPGMMAKTHRRPGGWGAEPSGDMLPERDGEDRAFGIEIEMTGITFGNARAALSAAGLPVDERDAYSTKNFAAWCACQDGSLGYGDPEIKLPPLSGEDGMELMRRTVKALRDAGGRAGRQRTHGLHVHIDARSLSRAKRFELAETYANNRDLINQIVAPNRNAGAGQYAAEGYSTGHGGRELALNLGSPTVEFRRFGSNLVADDIEGWAVLMRCIVNYQKHHDGALPTQSSLLALMQALDVPITAQEKILARVQRITPNSQDEA